MELSVPDLAAELLDALDRGVTVTPPSARWPTLGFDDAYAVAAEVGRLRRARGERPVGRKIGYTNRTIWPQYNVHQPIWDYVYAHTVHYAAANQATLSLKGMVAPRLEPEIAFKLRTAPPPDCEDPTLLLECVEWMAHTFEIVDCHFPGWAFSGPDSVIDFSHHAALVIGEPQTLNQRDIGELLGHLRDCRVRLWRNGSLVGEGVGANALGHPVTALAHLVSLLASQPKAIPLGAGELVTTGTLTALEPVVPGDRCRTEFTGVRLPGLQITFA